MATHRQGMANHYGGNKNRGLGSSGMGTDSRQLWQSIFGAPNSFLAAPEVMDQNSRKLFQAVLDDKGHNDGGHTFFGDSEVNMDFGKAPDITQVESGPSGMPGSPWVPNPVSPGEGNGVNPAMQTEPPQDYGTTPSDTPFTGDGHALTPNESATRISTQNATDGQNSLKSGRSS
jgi:hypothetical protein